MRRRPEDVLKEWMMRVNTGDVEHLLAMYDDKAVLLPTFSNRMLNDPAKIRDYFERLATREDLSIALHEKTLAVQQVSPDIASLSGIYCWRFAMEGELMSFEARFTYLIDLSRPAPILHHHSSQLPRMI